MPLAFGPYSLTVIKEDGTELNYITPDFNHSKTIWFKFTYGDGEVSDTLDLYYVCADYHTYKTDDNVPSKMAFTYYPPENTLVFRVGSIYYTCYIHTNKSYIYIVNRKDICNEEYYYKGLNLTDYSKYMGPIFANAHCELVMLYGRKYNVKMLYKLILVASQLDTSLVYTLLSLC